MTFDSGALLDTPLKSETEKWRAQDWENYLTLFDVNAPKEEIYVGTSHDLEELISKLQRPGASRLKNALKLLNQGDES